MKFNTFMLVYAVISAVFGLGFVFIPGLLLPIYGVEPDAALKLIGQLFGAVLISLALLAWLVRNLRDSETQRAVTLALLVGEALGFIVALIGQLNGVFNALGWSVIVVYLFFTLGLAYLLFSKSAS
jgi:uncharacterized membrane protein